MEEKLEQTFDKKAEMTEALWGLDVKSSEHHVTVHQQIRILDEIINRLANQMVVEIKVSQINQ